jgi:hypothetical protein
MTRKELETFIAGQVDHRLAGLEQRVSELERDHGQRRQQIPEAATDPARSSAAVDGP